mmetsp:Transcript_39995/g.66341  ORF Transcript_39995/g.66341 Transcript_39995/m.66341 type:complete len:297 (+) Transcript_39995:83-973(+)|eukprot:CAMPEP_0119301898 /NCGR_PEP_ID=MMETSP1333-20130426/3601_1 /TAXON_ID=418940 /ORGANISM="Scyphosphaera apsteinii, Strain RCC1455" /LENGTH=296 /DNA_ID=CAMNT_0007304107 /DNA_START=212 /DNA_END=1102 /DNA_ORIENTATION=-
MEHRIAKLEAENAKLRAENLSLHEAQERRQANHQLRAGRQSVRIATDSTRIFVPFAERSEVVACTDPGAERLLATIQRAKLARANWDGVPMLKSPFDALILIELLRTVRPASIIELGALAGGAALFLRDQTNALGLPPVHILSIDINLKKLHPTARRATSVAAPNGSRLSFLEGDCAHLERTLTSQIVSELKRPLLVLEDAHEALDEVLEFIDTILQGGDYLVVEDTIDVHKMMCLRAFLTRREGAYEVDTYLNDFWGTNITWNPNGYLRKVESPPQTLSHSTLDPAHNVRVGQSD